MATAESFNGKMRDQLLNGELFYTRNEANHHRTLEDSLQKKHGPSAQQSRGPATCSETIQLAS